MLFQHEKIEYAEEVTLYDQKVGFNDMNLSRPLLKVNTHSLTRFISFYRDMSSTTDKPQMVPM